jgi:hypothetical protein
MNKGAILSVDSRLFCSFTVLDFFIGDLKDRLYLDQLIHPDLRLTDQDGLEPLAF